MAKAKLETDYKDLSMRLYKRIAELEDERSDLDMIAKNYAIKISELEAQIEKMKCCGNCKNFNNFHEHCELDATHSVECHCNNYKLWEIKEK